MFTCSPVRAVTPSNFIALSFSAALILEFCPSHAMHPSNTAIMTPEVRRRALPPQRDLGTISRLNLQNLQEQINSLVEFLPRVNHCFDTPQNSMSRPSQGAIVLDFGDLKTSMDEKRTLRPASKDRLETLTSLQRFNFPEWRKVRYSSALKEFIASPGFTDLKVSEELCHLERKKDSLLLTEKVLTGLSNAILEQRELIKSGLQSIIDGSFSNLNSDTLFNSFESLFGPGSQIQKNLNQMSQVICGKKADLSSLIQSLGGAQNWLNTPAYITSRRGYRGEVPVHKLSSSRTIQSSAGPTLPSTSRFKFRRNKTNTRGSFQKPQSIPKPSGSFRKKPADT